MAAKIKALQQWCSAQCDGYRDVHVTNMTTSWKSGLGFCAIIHRFHPDLIDYESLSKENVYENNKLAFDTAESLGIAALLDPEDMVTIAVPDKLCIVTYLSQYYNHFVRCKSVGGPAISAVKRSADKTVHDVAKKPALPAGRRPGPQESNEAKLSTWQDKCSVCHEKVYLMERRMSGKRVYHRHCFRQVERDSSCFADEYVLPSCDMTSRDTASNKSKAAFLSSSSASVPSLPPRPACNLNVHHTSASNNSDSIPGKPPGPTVPLPSSSSSTEHSSKQLPTKTGAVSAEDHPASVDRQTGLVDLHQNGGTSKEAVSHIYAVMTGKGSAAGGESTPSNFSSHKQPQKGDVAPPLERLENGLALDTTNGSPSSDSGHEKPVPSKASSPLSPSVSRPVPPVAKKQAVSPTATKPLQSPLKLTSPSPGITHDASSTAVEHSASELPKSSVHACVNARPAIPKRPPPVSPSVVLQKSANSQQNGKVTGSDNVQSTESSSSVVKATETASVASPFNGDLAIRDLQPEVRVEKPPSKEQHDEDTASATSVSRPVPMPRQPQPAKSAAPAAGTETTPVSPGVSVTRKDSANEEPKAVPVAKPRKVSPQDSDGAETTGEVQSDAKHGDTEPSAAGDTVAGQKADNDVFLGSSVSSPTSDKPGKPIVVAVSQTPVKINLSPVPSVENKVGDSSSPPVKYPRSKKTFAAPLPPRPSGSVSSELDSSKAEVAVTLPPPRPLPPTTKLQHTEKLHMSEDGKSKQGLAADTEPVRKKISPGVKFTFETDAFQPRSISASSVTSTSDRPKPSRPAPPRPAAPAVTKRKVSAEEQLPVDFIKQRLTILDSELMKVEQEGRNLENSIRTGFENKADADDDDDDDMMSEWLDMVQQKNELVREESDLIYRLRQQELEDRHSQVEFELRQLMIIPEHSRTEAQKSREAELLQQLILTVHRRNNIVDSMEEDRKRYLQEDEEISQMKATQGIGRKKKAG